MAARRLLRERAAERKAAPSRISGQVRAEGRDTKMTKTASGPSAIVAPKAGKRNVAPKAGKRNVAPRVRQRDNFTLEDVAHFADATGELPADTAVRLQAFVHGDDPKQDERTRRLIGSHLEALRQMAEDAGVEMLVDAVFVFRIFERLRSETWEKPDDVLHHGVEVPYKELISMAGAHAQRADAALKVELERLSQRLMIALGRQIRDQDFVELLIDRLLEVGEEAADEALSQVVALYRRRREVAAN